MAKQQPDISNPFAKTEPGGLSSKWGESDRPELTGHADLDGGRIQQTGVGLRVGEIEALDLIGQTLGVSRNALLRWAARRLIIDYREGRLDLARFIETPPEPKKKLRMP